MPEGYGDVVEVLDKSCGDPHVFTPEQFVEYVKEQLSQMEDDEDRDDEWSSVDEDNINEVVEFANEYLGCDAEVFESKKFTKVSDQTGCFLTKRAAKKHIELNGYHYNNPRTFAMTAWRNPEFEKFLNIFEMLDLTELERLVK